MGPATVTYGILMLLTGAAAWDEMETLSWVVLLPIIVGALATPVGLLAGDVRARKPAIALAGLLSIVALLASSPGTFAALSLMFDDTLRTPNSAATQVAMFTFSLTYAVVAVTVWGAERREQRMREGMARRSAPNPSSGYAVSGA